MVRNKDLVGARLTQAVAAHREGRLAAAQAAYEDILRVQPAHFDALNLLGVIAVQRLDARRGVALIEQAIAIDPRRAGVHVNLATGLTALHRLDEAVAAYDRALALEPRMAEAHAGRGQVLTDLGRPAEALASCDQAIALKPDLAEAHNNRGYALRALGRPADALDSFDRALALKPDFALAWSNRGNALVALKRAEDALASFERAVAIKPDFAEAYSNHGNALCALQRMEEALASCDRALALRPGLAEAHNNRGNALREIGRAAEALASYDRALELRRDYAEAHSNRGNALRDLGRPAEALASCDRALALRPEFVEACDNRGLALQCLGRRDEALAAFEAAVAARPDYAPAHWNESLCRLALGDYERGWRKYEWRWRLDSLAPHKRDFAQPLWLGKEALRGRTILLHAEQGLGDTLQFVRYAPLAAGLGARVLLLVQKPLKTLLSAVEGVAEVHAEGEALPAFDFHCPLMSLPLAFRTAVDGIPAALPYLHADPARAARWQARLDGSALNVGLVWAGSPRTHDPRANKVDRRRSTGLAQFAPLAGVPGVRFVSLQKGLAAEQAAQPPAGMALVDHTAELDDFADTAALVAALDLVISVDTSVAHLAGGMGKPVWILSRFDGCWRWLLERDDSPWYPTARLFRQRTPGDWAEVMERMADALRQWRAPARSAGAAQPEEEATDGPGKRG